MKRIIFMALLVFLFSTVVFAEYNPPDGTELYYDLFSPTFLAGGDNSAAFESPASDVLNPALAGLKQRVTLDFSYLGIIGSDIQPGYGNAINAGITLPKPFGVFSASAHLITSPSTFTNPDMGSLLAINGSFAKDLFPDLLIGVGIEVILGSNEDSDWAAGANLGFLHLAGDLGFFKDFRWGVAMRGLGKGFDPVAGRTSYPAPFTPALGIFFNIIRTDSVRLGLNTDLSFPVFQNVRANLGAELAVKDVFFLRTSFPMDVKEWLAGNLRWPGFGFSIRFKTKAKEDAKWSRSELNINLGAAPLPDGQWAFGVGLNLPLGVVDREPPVVTLGDTEKYISPNLDGTQDDLSFSLNIEDERYIMGYRLIVSDEAGNIIREIRNKDIRPENEGIKRVIDRLVYVKKGIDIPDSLRWDGRKDDGTLAADGAYRFAVEAWDDNGNILLTDPVNVVIDNTAPVVSLGTPKQQDLIFSPNNDGNKDTLPVIQQGSAEDLWEGSVEDANGQVVAQFKWENQAPGAFQWDGKNLNGILVPDGVYTYKISAVDRAGNKVSSQVGNIIVNTEATPIKVGIDKSIFSPNQDNKLDTVTINLDVPVVSGIETWNLRIINTGKKVIHTYSGTDDLPSALIYDGRDSSGDIIDEGTYKAILEIMYVNGNNPVAESPEFSVDLTPPYAEVAAELSIFSPNGDGNRDVLPIFQESSDETIWYGIIESEAGVTVKEYSWQGKADARIVWDGLSSEGRLAEDGTYGYRLFTTDKAGNEGSSKTITFNLDTEETSVILFAEYNDFSPNGDGVRDKIKLIPKLRVESGIDKYELKILNSTEEEIRIYSGKNTIPDNLTWDGLTADGRKAQDGEYQAELLVVYKKGDVPKARTNIFYLDTLFPEAEASAVYTLFSPDGDGRRDEIAIKQSSSDEALWEAAIYNPRGEVVRNFFWKERVANVSWDGKDENGNTTPDGVYRYILNSTDAAGNYTEILINDIRVDSRPTPVFITVSSEGFSPNNDGYRETQKFNIFVNITEGVKSWSLSMVDKDGITHKVFSDQKLPNTITWNGMDDSGKIVEGIYQGIFKLEYEKGNQPEARTTSFVLDVSPPDVELTTYPMPFSPDNDGIDDELTISLKTKDLSEIEDWKMIIKDSMEHDFTSLSGVGKPAEKIIWDGRSDWGELVQSAEDYIMTFTIGDTLRNRMELTRKLPVDVLVIRDGDRLKIRIASITFAPNSPDLITGDTQKSEKNIATLKRLAEIINKYKAYRILIEGHANNLSWADPVKAKKEEEEVLQPLSLSRADTVKHALGELGVDIGRITTAGLGGTQPIIPFSDLENRWKNRRVEFILIKK
jgi:flagellar hook assembly protein FlgD/outer membrane protein OmpA-like peptidoglycan-associated protein